MLKRATSRLLTTEFRRQHKTKTITNLTINTFSVPTADFYHQSTNINTTLKIKRTEKVIKIESKNALGGLKFDTEVAKT